MEDHNTTDNNINTTDERIFKESTSSDDTPSRQVRGPYNTKNDIKVAKMINLLQEFECMSIKVAAATLPYSTAKQRVNQWNEACNNGKDVFPGSSKKSGAKSKLNDKHTVFVFEKIHEQLTISCNDITDLLCQHFKGLNITSRAVNEHMQTKRPNLSILGAITAHGVITLSRREVCAPTNKKRKADTGTAPKKGTTRGNFMKFIKQVLTNIDAHDLRIDTLLWITLLIIEQLRLFASYHTLLS
ncbi:hypothetical protein INT45_009349 [Circinella minor]|uniref:Uncharacterized protein n=1 Tax=Circinella minor TaxID=1195481 RepID=A0A8H7VM20_9FUNG|nr:hypothetical protein INT45_009349 [Circinella minor]